MATTATVKSFRVSVKVETGTSETGAIITSSISFPTINPENVTNDKIMAVEEALEPLLNYDVSSVQTSEIKTLSTQ